MEKPLPLAALLILFPAFSGALCAQNATPKFDPLGEFEDRNLPQLVRVKVEFIEMPKATLSSLMEEPEKSADSSQLRKKVGQLAKEGEAEILETMVVTGRSGEKSTSESVQEFIYPTEYEPPSFPDHSDGSEDGENRESGSPSAPGGPLPTAFETRNTGSTLETVPYLSDDGRVVDLNFSVEIVDHVGNDTWAEWKDLRGDASVRMPKFYKLSVNTAVTLVAGEPTMVAVLSPKTGAGVPDHERKVMVFVRCEVLTVGR